MARAPAFSAFDVWEDGDAVVRRGNEAESRALKTVRLSSTNNNSQPISTLRFALTISCFLLDQWRLTVKHPPCSFSLVQQ